MVQCSKTNTLQFQRRSIWDGRIKQADSQLSKNVYFIDILPLGYLLSVKELKISAFGAPAYSGRHFEFVYLTPSAEPRSSFFIPKTMEKKFPKTLRKTWRH